jgi:peptidoglycan/LPS O-acetylase OafA/YrhL
MLKHLIEIKKNLRSEILTVPDVLNGSYYRSIDGLRGVAISLVVLYHFGMNYYTRSFPIHFAGRTGVNIFFVISGFLITTLLIKEKIRSGKISLRYFFIRRVLRIIPVVYLFLIVLITLNLYYDLKISTLNFVASFLFFKNLPLKSHHHFLTTHLWSLAVEGQFYITFPFLLAANINRYFITALLIIIIVPLLSIFGFYYTGLSHLSPLIQQFIKIMMYAFWNGPVMILTGSVFSILLFKGMIKTGWIGKTYFAGIFLFIMAIVIQSRTFIYYHKYISEYLSVLILAYCTVLSVKTDDLLTTILKSSILVRIGIISYSIYIWQELFIGLRPWEPWLSFWSSYPIYLFTILKLSSLLVVSAVSYYFYESRFLKWGKAFR